MKKLHKIIYLLMLATFVFCINSQVQAAEIPITLSTNTRSDGLPHVNTLAQSGKIYIDRADLIFFASASTAGLYTHYRCVYTDASGVGFCIEDNVTRHEENEVYITKSYEVEGIYDIEFYCQDFCGSISETLSVSIAVDSNAPEISFLSTADGMVCKDGIDLPIETKEMFYDLMNVEIDVTVLLDGTESKFTLPYDIQAPVNKNIYKFTESGKYTINVTAADGSGHVRHETLEFAIDDEPPDISIKNEDELLSGKKIVSKAPDFYINITDGLSDAAAAEIVLARKEGNVYKEIKRHKLSKNTGFSKCVSLDGEGFYTLKITAEDTAQNKSEKTLDITLDKTPPVIGYLSDFNEKYLNSFTMPDNFKTYIQDLTDTVYKSYLNSKSFSGGTITNDGKYILQVVCEDEAGNSAEEMIAFIIDNVHPKIVVNGIDPDGNVNDGYIRLSLLDSDDYFESVTINGESIAFDTTKKELNIKTGTYESYEICVTAKDFAGNETVETFKAKSALGAINSSPISRNMKTLTKNGIKNSANLFLSGKGAGFWIFCGIVFVAAVIFIVFALFDIKHIS